MDNKTEKALLYLKHKIDKRFAKTDAKIDLIGKDMEALRKDLTIKMGSMFMVALGILLPAINLCFEIALNKAY